MLMNGFKGPFLPSSGLLVTGLFLYGFDRNKRNLWPVSGTSFYFNCSVGAEVFFIVFISKQLSVDSFDTDELLLCIEESNCFLLIPESEHLLFVDGCGKSRWFLFLAPPIYLSIFLVSILFKFFNIASWAMFLCVWEGFGAYGGNCFSRRSC